MLYVKSTLLKDNEDYYDPKMNDQLRNMLDYFNSDFCDLREREKDVMIQRYALNKTFLEIANQYSISKERVKQIEAKAIRLLRHPSRLKYIIHGVKLREIEVELQEYEKELVQKTEEIQSLIEKFSELKIDMSEELQEKLRIHNFIKGNGKQATIDDLNLDTRSYKCLERSGLYYVEDVVKNIKQLPKIRNLGVKSTKVIMSALKDGGYIE